MQTRYVSPYSRSVISTQANPLMKTHKSKKEDFLITLELFQSFDGTYYTNILTLKKKSISDLFVEFVKLFLFLNISVFLLT